MKRLLLWSLAILALSGTLFASEDPGPKGARERFSDGKAKLEVQLQKLRGVLERDVSAFNDLVKWKAAPAVLVSGE